MAKSKKTSKKVKPAKQKQSQKTSVNIVTHIKNHLLMDMAMPLGVLLVLLVLVLVKLPYQAKENYIEIEQYEVLVNEVVPDLDSPMDVRVCTQVPKRYEIGRVSTYILPYGKSDYICYGQFDVTNHDDDAGEWTYRFLFNISGMEVRSEPKTMYIPRIATMEFKFETPCLADDKLSGTYELISAPTAEDCHYEKTYQNMTVTNREQKEREVQKERIITKYEPLWQKFLGYNNFEKV